MRPLIVFNSISLDGFFTDAKGDMSWAHAGAADPEWAAFVAGNAQGGDTLLFGRVTYEMMAAWWPTPAAKQAMPVVAGRMNAMRKVVASRTLRAPEWNNTSVLEGDLVAAVRALKEAPGGGIAIFGSGSLVPPLAQAGLIDEFQFVVTPWALGGGRTMFAGLPQRLRLELVRSRVFGNGNVFLGYRPVA